MKFYSVRCRRLETPRTEVFVSAFTVNSLKSFCSLVLDVRSETSFIPKLSLSDGSKSSLFHPRYLSIHQKIKAISSSKNLGGNGLSLVQHQNEFVVLRRRNISSARYKGVGGGETQKRSDTPPPPTPPILWLWTPILWLWTTMGIVHFLSKMLIIQHVIYQSMLQNTQPQHVCKQ